MREEPRLPAWKGGLAGVVVAAILTWLLQQGSRTRILGVATTGGGSDRLPFSVWVVLLTGLFLGVTVLMARRHVLISAVPALWLTALFGPPLFGSLDILMSYPSWMFRYIMEATSAVPLIAIGILAVSAIETVVGSRLPPQRSSTST